MRRAVRARDAEITEINGFAQGAAIAKCPETSKHAVADEEHALRCKRLLESQGDRSFLQLDFFKVKLLACIHIKSALKDQGIVVGDLEQVAAWLDLNA
jgi:hypothetical protein